MTLLLALLSLASAQNVPAPNLHVGDAALLFSLPALNEEAALRVVARPHVALSDFTGVLPGFPAKAVVVHFMVRKDGEGQLAALNRLQRKYGAKGVRVLVVMSESGDIAGLSGWIGQQRLDFPVLRDAHGIVVDRYGVRQFPMTFVVDGDGYLAAVGAPRADLETSLDGVLAGLVK